MARQSKEVEEAVRDKRQTTRRQFAAEEKVRIVIAGLHREDSIAELCRKDRINQNLYYRRSKDFLEAGKKRLAGDTARCDQRRSEGTARAAYATRRRMTSMRAGARLASASCAWNWTNEALTVASVCAQMKEEAPSGNIALDGFHAVVAN